MHATTIRRTIVFGVCAIGVGCLYLVPSMARSPEQYGGTPRSEKPTGRPAGFPIGDPSATETSSMRAGQSADRAPTTTDGTRQPARERQPRAGARPSRGATAFETADRRSDSEPPTPVRDLSATGVNSERLDLSWAPAGDDVGVVGYRLWLNGFQVATTAETSISLRWFNDDTGQHVVQVRALDAAGNESATSPTLILTRPSTEPSATPTPSPSDPAPSPSPDTSSSAPQPQEGGSTSDAPSPTPDEPR